MGRASDTSGSLSAWLWHSRGSNTSSWACSSSGKAFYFLRVYWVRTSQRGYDHIPDYRSLLGSIHSLVAVRLCECENEAFLSLFAYVEWLAKKGGMDIRRGSHQMRLRGFSLRSFKTTSTWNSDYHINYLKVHLVEFLEVPTVSH